MRLSVIIPAFNAARTIERLLSSLSAQVCQDFETFVIDDGSTDNTFEITSSFHCKCIRLDRNKGPAYCRNIGAKMASGDVYIFTDSDCQATPEWIENILHNFQSNNIDAIMGKLFIRPSSLLGDSISALGFPAGGAIGFDKIWRVDEQGFTHSLSTCNCAIKKESFWRAGGFDETFPYPGGEDSLMAYNLTGLGFRIKYCPDVIVFHEARNSLNDFLRWQFKRGISSFLFSRKINRPNDYMRLRAWSTANIISHYMRDIKFPLIFSLLCIGYMIQFIGFSYAKWSDKFDEGFNH